MSTPRRGGLTKALFSNKTWPWAITESLLTFALFESFSQLSQYSRLPSAQHTNFITALVFAMGLALGGIGFGLFEREARLSRLVAARRLLYSGLASLSVSLTLVHFVFFLQPGRYSLIYGFAGSFVGLLLWHSFVTWLAHSFPHRWFVLGSASAVSPEIEAVLVSQMRPASRLYHAQMQTRIHAARVGAPSPEDFVDLLLEEGVSDVILPREARRDPWVTLVAVRALQGGLRVVDERSLFAEIFRRYPADSLDIDWALGAGFDIQRPITNFIKRCFDIVLAIVVLVLFSPVYLILIVAIKLESPGPVFFVQERQGRHFRPFRMIKFRSMRTDSSGSRVTSKSDSRVTRIGALMRPPHFDELPQVWNILRGDMSFVGPRPAMIDTIREVRTRTPIFEIRQMLRPGLTGLAQISQGYSMDSDSELQEKLGFDLFYVRHYSLAFDLWIILRTAFNLAKKAW
jgi:exopolysaccharide biosynthesis polyprenyl glycosylphosphotransferase